MARHSFIKEEEMKKHAWHGILAAVLGIGLSVSAVAGEAGGADKLAGAWVAKVPGTTLQWNYVVSPDPSGRRASAIGMIDVGIYLGEQLEVDRTSPLLVEIVMTDRDTADFYSIWYGLRKVPGPEVTAQVVFIGTNVGQLKLAGPGKAEAFGTLRIYLPSADADQDGFPDVGAEPIVTIPAYTVDTRLPVPE
jgi:hypothetical protein